MKLERSNVDFPLWRKKVDKSLFEHNGTHIPSWACEICLRTTGKPGAPTSDNWPNSADNVADCKVVSFFCSLVFESY